MTKGNINVGSTATLGQESPQRRQKDRQRLQMRHGFVSETDLSVWGFHASAQGVCLCVSELCLKVNS